MSWVTHRNTIQAVAWVSLFFLLGGGNLIGLGLTENIKSSGITIAHWLAAGMAYIIWSFYARYI
jgi:hypothetical protein